MTHSLRHTHSLDSQWHAGCDVEVFVSVMTWVKKQSVGVSVTTLASTRRAGGVHVAAAANCHKVDCSASADPRRLRFMRDRTIVCPPFFEKQYLLL